MLLKIMMIEISSILVFSTPIFHQYVSNFLSRRQIENIRSHGCHCSKLENYWIGYEYPDEVTPVDKVDRHCKDWLVFASKSAHMKDCTKLNFSYAITYDLQDCENDELSKNKCFYHLCKTNNYYLGILQPYFDELEWEPVKSICGLTDNFFKPSNISSEFSGY